MPGALDIGSQLFPAMALGQMSGENVDPNQLVAMDPRLDQVINAATKAAAPDDNQKWKDEQLAFAGGTALNPSANAGAAILGGFGAQSIQRNKQKELLGQYLPVIAPVLMQQQFLRNQANILRMSQRVQGGEYGPVDGQGAAQGALAGAGGAGGPGMDSGAPMASGALSAQQGQGSMQQRPRQSYITGIPDAVSSRVLAGMNPELSRAELANYAPTPQTLQANQSGGMLGVPMANLAGFLKSVAPETMGRSGVTWSALTGYGSVPGQAIPGHYQPVDPATGAPSGPPIPYALGALSDVASAERKGVNRQTSTTGIGPNGPTYRTADQDVNAASGGGGGGGTGQDGRYPSNPGGGSGDVRPEYAPDERAARITTGGKSADLHAADSMQANGYSTRQFTLQKALAGLAGADTGPGSEAMQNAKSFLLAQTPEAMHRYLPGVDPSKIEKYDEANKYLIQYAMGQAGAMGQGTNEKLAAALTGNANTHISNLAAQDVVRANMGLEAMRQAQLLEFNKRGQPTSQYQGFSTNWNKDVDPRVFVYDYLSPDKRAAMRDSMKPAEIERFKHQYNWALQNHYIEGQ